MIRRALLGAATLLVLACGGDDSSRRLVVFNAGSLGRPFREALDSFAVTHPGLVVAQENAGSLESARKLTELGKTPDLIALADEGVFPALLVPAHTEWYAAFARNEMVLAYTDRSAGANEITSENWAEVIRRPGVRTGRSDPALDPNGYRTLMVLQLEERRSGRAGLAAQLLSAMPERYLRPKEADLVALLQAGELDYAWSYRSVAQAAGLKYVDLPPEVDLSDPGRTELYATASVTIPRSGPPSTQRPAPSTVTILGAPILYALGIPRAATNQRDAEEFVRWLFGPDGRRILERNGFTVLESPIFHSEFPASIPAGLTRH